MGQILIKGIISNSTKTPIAQVKISSGTNGENTSYSNDKGEFSLSINNEVRKIYLSHLSYERKIVDVFLNDDFLFIQLDSLSNTIEEVEVLHTGYTVLPKERATGSFEHLNVEDLNKRVSSSILDKLEGQVSGLQFDKRSGDTKINIRGINTMSEILMGPLIVVDNFPYEGNIEDINPNDVASVTFLKDAAAASIWGARAGNGVIVINLKKPQLSSLNIGLTSNLSIADKPRINHISRMSSGEFIDVERMLFDKGFYNASYNNINTRLTLFSPVVDMLFDHRNGHISSDQLESNISHFREINFLDDVQKYIYKQGYLQQYNLSMSKGNEGSAFRLSLSYNGTHGEKIGDKDHTISINAQNELKLSSHISLSTRLTLQHVNGQQDLLPLDHNFSPGGGKSIIYPYARLKDENGINQVLPYQLNSRYIEGLLENTDLLDWRFIPLNELGENINNSNRRQVEFQTGLNYKIANFLQINSLYNYQTYTGDSQFLRTEESFYTRNLINRYTQFNNGIPKYIIPLGGINQLSNSKMQSHKFRSNIQFDKSSQDKQHIFFAIAGGEVSSVITNQSGYTAYGYDPLLMTNQQVDFLNFYPIYDGLSGNSRIPNVDGINETTRRLVSFFTNWSYTYKNRYTTTFSARRDASNLFGVNTNDKWNPLWSAGLLWAMHKESFMEKVNWINAINIRSTYGHSGNSGGVATSLPLISYSSGSSTSLTTFPRAMVTALPNPSLKWEDVRMINLGLSFEILNRTINGSIEYFNKKSTDLLSTENIDPTVGLSSIRQNIGVLAGNGFDIKLGTRHRLGAVNLSSTLFLSAVKDVVKKYYGNISNAGSYMTSAGKLLRPLPDKQLYPVLALNFAGLDPLTGSPQGTFQGQISQEYQKMINDSLHNAVYYGTGIPPYHGSLRQQIAWKNINLSFLINYKFGHYYQKQTINYTNLFNGWYTHGDYALRWQNPGDELTTTVPSMLYPANNIRDQFYAFSEANIRKGDLIRLQDVSLSYTYKWDYKGKKYPVSILATSNNVALLWKSTDDKFDPDYLNIPPSRRYSIGIDVKF
ncbi:SusC/RagA family TonB-linked outer membrane protein [Sphingobacterium bovisgrunnientis]|uniref:SusC/RagA family TonB-linked outer membrane protein n=1 Tax=Sphingobacterium bovisgrunnientis TaxID=1874697 RepID=UPI00135ABC01|nr:SusC/RagA family TonB-linked outer membrane protein [Sphingobacterium bovisgrunnientis]